jgi:tRNA1(Val) A37 N6-methylase TrmN6
LTSAGKIYIVPPRTTLNSESLFQSTEQEECEQMEAVAISSTEEAAAAVVLLKAHRRACSFLRWAVAGCGK